MTWQDWVLSIGNFIFAAALIPSIRSSSKPALSTCIITAIVLILFVVAFLSLQFFLSAFAVTFSAIGYYILAYQKYRQR